MIMHAEVLITFDDLFLDTVLIVAPNIGIRIQNGMKFA